MPFRTRYEAHERRRYTRHSTKHRLPLRPPAHPGRIVAVALAAVGVIVLALICGSVLKARSDSYREAQAADAWTLNEDTATAIPAAVPALRAVAIEPEASVGDILIAGEHEGVLLPLCDAEGTPYFASRVADEAGLPVSPDAPSLTDEVARIRRRGLRVICTFTVTFPEAADTASATYRRGLELALLCELAEAGFDDLLLMGLPAGNDADDAQSVDFFTELRALLATLPTQPAVGVALSIDAFASDSARAEADASPNTAEGASSAEETASLYAGAVSPARLRRVCDYLSLDLRTYTAEEVAALLPRLQYAYVRHSLRLVLNREDDEAVSYALSHGFERVFEMPQMPG